MADEWGEHRGSTTREGFAVLGVAIKREPAIFILSTLGSFLFGAMTVADAWVLGWATDNVLVPAFRTGEIGPDMQPTVAQASDRLAGARNTGALDATH